MSAARKLDSQFQYVPIPERVTTLEMVLQQHLRTCRRTMLRVEGLLWAIVSFGAYHVDWLWLVANIKSYVR